MKLNELENKFNTNIITLSQIGSIFHTKEYEIGKFYKDNYNNVVKKFGEREIDFYDYKYGIIVLQPK